LVGAIILSCLSSELYSYFYYFYLIKVGFHDESQILKLELCMHNPARDAAASSGSAEPNQPVEESALVHAPRDGAG
jgi:hypothetical protein